MNKFLITIIILAVVFMYAAVIISVTSPKKVESFDVPSVSTLKNVKIIKISNAVGEGLYKVDVNDTLSVLIYSEKHGNSIVRIK